MMSDKNTSDDTPNIEPTDKSNSPEIIRKATPTATIPLVDWLVKMEASEFCVRKFWLAVSEKKIIRAMNPMSAPASGERVNCVRMPRSCVPIPFEVSSAAMKRTPIY